MAKKTETKKKESKAKAVAVKNLADKTVKELKFDLQKLILDIKSGVETNTTKVRAIKKEIARKLTQINQEKLIK